MKHVKKILALVLAMVMVMAMGVTAFAAELPTGTPGADKTITITPPTGLDKDAENTYTVYKVFDADTDGTVISYKSLDGTAPEGFVVDDAMNVYLGAAADVATGAEGEISIKVDGATKYIVPSTADELTDIQIAAIAAYTGKVEVGTVTITGPTATTVTVPSYGYYYITTSTGTVVSINSTKKSASVQDKNTVPTLDKKITGASSITDEGKKALAQIGTDVTYTATITVGKGMRNYVFHDKMSDGLTLKKETIAISINGETAATDAYTIKETPDPNDTLTITFADGLAEGTVIDITYSATINELALEKDPENNTAYVSYGDENSHNKTPDSSTKTWNAQIAVQKNKGDGTALSGAGFVLKKAGKYYHLNNENPKAPVVEWLDTYSEVDVHTSVADGKVPPFIGLCAGEYTLEEVVVPAGYNKATDTEVTILSTGETTYTDANLDQTKTIVNNSGSVLPSTGGIGTTIFYVVGSILLVGAAILLITKRRMKAA